MTTPKVKQWDGRENSSYKAGFRAGMRAAAEMCHGVVVRGDILTMELTAQRIADAILSEADK